MKISEILQFSMEISKILKFSMEISEILRPRLLRGWPVRPRLLRGWPAGLGSVPESSQPTGPTRMDARRFFLGKYETPKDARFRSRWSQIFVSWGLISILLIRMIFLRASVPLRHLCPPLSPAAASPSLHIYLSFFVGIL